MSCTGFLHFSPDAPKLLRAPPSMLHLLQAVLPHVTYAAAMTASCDVCRRASSSIFTQRHRSRRMMCQACILKASLPCQVCRHAVQASWRSSFKFTTGFKCCQAHSPPHSGGKEATSGQDLAIQVSADGVRVPTTGFSGFLLVNLTEAEAKTVR